MGKLLRAPNLMAGMNITVYLPEAVGRAARDAGLPLSRMLREAVERELSQEPEDEIEPGVRRSGDALVIDPDLAAGVVPAASTVRIEVSAMRRWLKTLASP